jgi:hypothetical protein
MRARHKQGIRFNHLRAPKYAPATRQLAEMVRVPACGLRRPAATLRNRHPLRPSVFRYLPHRNSDDGNEQADRGQRPHRLRLKGEQTESDYAAVIVDEVQDISEIALRSPSLDCR